MPIQLNSMGICGVVCGCVFVLYLLRETVFTSGPAVISKSTNSQISLRSLLCVSILAAQRGGAEVKKVREKQTLNTKDKDGGLANPVTDGDLKSHHVMMRTLTDTFPGLKVMSEEHDDTLEAHHSSVYVGPVDKKFCPSDVLAAIPHDTNLSLDDLQLWIDPLDATQEYTENLVNYVTTMVGIAVKGKAVAGVIHKPFATERNDKIFWAWTGQSSSENLKHPVRTSEALKIIISRSHSGDLEQNARASFTDRALEIVPAGGAGFKSLEVLLGRADVYLHTTKIKKWDLCAPNGIFNALGGRLSTLAGTEVDYTAPKTSEDSVNYGGVIAALTDHAHFAQVFSSLRVKELL